MPRSVQIGLLGFAGLVFYFLIVAYMQAAILTLCLCACTYALLGLLFFRVPSRFTLPLRLPPQEDGEQPACDPKIEIDGAAMDLNHFFRPVTFDVRLRNVSLILGCSLMAVLCLAAYSFSRGSLFAAAGEVHLGDSSSAVPISQALLYSSILFVAIAYAWFAERRLMARGTIALALTQPANKHFVRYEFSDGLGQRYGAIKRVWSTRVPEGGEITLVFYDPARPSKNHVSSSLIFHHVAITARE